MSAQKFALKMKKKKKKNGPHLSCDLHKIGANLYSKWPVAHFLCKKACWMDGWVDGWVGGWMDGWKSRFKDCLQQSKSTIRCKIFSLKQI